MLNESSTIAAISTAKGVGGIGVVRISGKRALEIAKNICTADLSPRKVEFTSFKDKKNVTLDQGIVIYFPSPSSFTGEDIVEFQVSIYSKLTGEFRGGTLSKLLGLHLVVKSPICSTSRHRRSVKFPNYWGCSYNPNLH